MPRTTGTASPLGIAALRRYAGGGITLEDHMRGQGRLQRWLATALATFLLLGWRPAAAQPTDPALQQAVASPDRSARFIARDQARHPLAELSFFGLRADQTVIEIWPGGGYWTEILAPYLRAHGRLIVAAEAAGDSAEGDAGLARLRQKLAASPELYDKVTLSALGPHALDVAPPGSADLVLTFRNLHNWMSDGYADMALAAFFRALKPGGILGIEEHRARSDRPQDPKADNGYVRQDFTIALAEQAGFTFLGSSEINANPKDSADWPKGVWTLPPTLALKDKDRDKYLAIGEADNFVLKFRKPKP
jgi:predicted methyltransferase